MREKKKKEILRCVFFFVKVQIVYFYRGIPRLPNTVIPGISPSLQPVLILSNTVQWIYGVSFAIALGLITVIGLLYEHHTRRASKRRIERSIARFLLVIVMVLIPLGGLDTPMTPIIQLIVGGVVMLALVCTDWAFNVALGPTIPDDVELKVVQVKVVLLKYLFSSEKKNKTKQNKTKNRPGLKSRLFNKELRNKVRTRREFEIDVLRCVIFKKKRCRNCESASAIATAGSCSPCAERSRCSCR
jgi:predicted outer membrane lipoprotein